MKVLVLMISVKSCKHHVIEMKMEIIRLAEDGESSACQTLL